MLEFIFQFLSSGTVVVGTGLVSLIVYLVWNHKHSEFTTWILEYKYLFTNQSIILPGPDRVRACPVLEDPNDPTKWTDHVEPDVRTVYDSFLWGLHISGNGPCLGWRNSSKEPYQWLSYKETLDRAHAFGCGLSHLTSRVGQDSLVAIYAINCPEWSIASLGLTSQSMVLVPLYDTLGQKSASYILRQGEIEIVICDTNERAQKLLKSAQDTPHLRHIIVIKESGSGRLTAESSANIQLHKFADIEAMGKNREVSLNLPKPEDLYIICYTSGTTGNPKGAMITHANCVAEGAMFEKPVMNPDMPITFEPGEAVLSYLPLAHMYQQIVHMVCHFFGMRIGFYQGDIRKIADDLQTLKPHLLPTVPRMLTRIYDGIQSKLEKASPIGKLIFKIAYESKLAAIRKGHYSKDTIWDKLIFNKVQASVGGENLKLMCVGAAPISEEVLTMCRVALGCLIVEGYGQTECTAGCSATLPGDLQCEHVGPPGSACHIKLVDVQEMGYYAKNDQGEICIKGPIVMKGYYKEPEKTREALDEDGWLHTGDIGAWTSEGRLRIIDRKKDLFKLAQGEYIAPAKTEAVYARCHLVSQIFVEGNSLQRHLVAVVAPDEAGLSNLAAELGLENESFESLCQNEQIRNVVLQRLQTLGKEAGLNSMEQIKAIHLTPEVWTVDNDLLTPTQKNKRPQLRKHYAQVVEKLYLQTD